MTCSVAAQSLINKLEEKLKTKGMTRIDVLKGYTMVANNIRLSDVATVTKQGKFNIELDTTHMSGIDAQAYGEYKNVLSEVQKVLDTYDLQFMENAIGDIVVDPAKTEKANSPLVILTDLVDGKNVIKPEVQKVLAYTLLDWVANSAIGEDRAKDIKSMLGLKEDDALSVEDYNRLKNVSGLVNTAYQRAGDVAWKNLGIKLDVSKVPEVTKNKLKTDLGIVVMKLANDLNYISLDVKRRNQANLKVGEYTPGYQQVKSEIFGYHVKTDKAKDIGTYKVNDKKFTFEELVKQRRTVKALAGLLEAESERKDPTFVKIDKKQPVKLGGAKAGFSDIDKTHSDAVKNMRDVEVRFDEGVMELINGLSGADGYNEGEIVSTDPEMLEMFGVTLDKGSVNDTQAASLDGKERAVKEDFEYLNEFYKTYNGNKKAPFYIDYVVNASNLRFTSVPNTFDPQNKKLHRFAVYFGNKMKVTKENMTNFKMAVGQALGVDVDKQTSTQSVKDFQKLMEDISGKLEEYYDDSTGKFSKEGKLEVTKEYIKKNLGQPAHAIAGMNAMFVYLENGGSGFETSLGLETDAITSGYILKLLQMPILGDSIDDTKAQLTKGGVMTDYLPVARNTLMKLFKTYNVNYVDRDVVDSRIPVVALMELKNKIKKDNKFKGSAAEKKDYLEKLSDSYEYPAARVAERLSKTLEDDEGALPFVKMIGDVQELAVSLSRAFMKDPFMIFNYGAGLGKIVNNKVNAVEEKMYTDLMHMPSEMHGIDSAIQLLINSKSGVDDRVLNEDIAKLEAIKAKVKNRDVTAKTDLKKFSMSTESRAAFRARAKGILESSIKDVFQAEYGQLMEATAALNTSMVNSFRLFKRRLDREILKYEKDNGRSPSAKEIEDITNSMADAVPMIRTVLGNKEDVKQRLILLDVATTAYEKTSVDGKTDLKETGQTWVQFGKEAGAKNGAYSNKYDVAAEAETYKLVEAYSQTAVLGIHHLDSSMIARVLTKYDMLGIHDAGLYNIDDVENGSRDYNKAVIELSKKYSLTKEVLENLNVNLNAASKEDVDAIDREVLIEKLLTGNSNIAKVYKEVKKAIDNYKELTPAQLKFSKKNDKVIPVKPTELDTYLENLVEATIAKGTSSVELDVKALDAIAGNNVAYRKYVNKLKGAWPKRKGKLAAVNFVRVKDVYNDIANLHRRAEDRRTELYNNKELRIDHVGLEKGVWTEEASSYDRLEPRVALKEDARKWMQKGEHAKVDVVKEEGINYGSKEFKDEVVQHIESNKHLLNDLRSFKVILHGKEVVATAKGFKVHPARGTVDVTFEVDGSMYIYSFIKNVSTSLSDKNGRTVSSDEVGNVVGRVLYSDLEGANIDGSGEYKQFEDVVDQAVAADKETFGNDYNVEEEQNLINTAKEYARVMKDFSKMKIKVVSDGVSEFAKGYFDTSKGEEDIDGKAVGEAVLMMSNGTPAYRVRNAMTNLQVLVHEMTHGVVEWGMNPKNVAAAKPRLLLQKLYEHARRESLKAGGWKILVPKDGSIYNEKEENIAKNMYQHIFGIDEHGRDVKGFDIQSGYQEFMAHIKTNKEFKAAMDTVNAKVAFQEAGIKPVSNLQRFIDKIIHMFTKALDVVFNMGDGVKPNDSVHSASVKLIDQMVALKDKEYNFVYDKGALGKYDKAASYMGLAVDKANEAVRPLTNMLNKMIVGDTDVPLSVKEVDKLLKVLKSLDHKEGDSVIKSWYKIIRSFPKLRLLLRGKTRVKGLNKVLTRTEQDLKRIMANAKLAGITQIFGDVTSGGTLVEGITDRIMQVKAKLDTARDSLSKGSVQDMINGFTKIDLRDDKNVKYNEVLNNVVLVADLQALNVDAKGLDEYLTNSRKVELLIEQKRKEILKSQYGKEILEDAGLMVDYMMTGKGLMSNAEQIARGFGNVYRIQDTKKIAPAIINKLIKDIDMYATGLALQRIPSNEKTLMSELITKDEKGVNTFLEVAEGLQAQSAKEGMRNDEYSHWKGFIRDTYGRTTDIEQIPENKVDVKLMKKLGYEKIDVIRATANDPYGDVGVWAKKNAVFTNLQDGALAMESKINRGYSLREKVYASVNEDMSLLAKKALFDRVFKRALVEWTTNKTKVKGMSPIYSIDGKIIDFVYTMSRDTKINKLDLETKATHNVGNTYSVIGTHEVAIKANEELVDFLNKDFNDNYIGNEGSYVTIQPDKIRKNKVGIKEQGTADWLGNTPIGELWAKIPQETKEYIIEKVGERKLTIRKDIAKYVFGYTELSIAQNRLAKRMFTAVGLNRIRKAEKVWQDMVSLAKNTIIIKLPSVAINNIKSNINLLMLQGFNPKRSAKFLYEARRTLKYFKADVKERDRLKRKKDRSRYQRRIDELDARIQSSPHNRLVNEKGQYQNIVEDIDLGAESNNLVENKLKELVKKLPKPVQIILNGLFLTSNTRWYKMMSDIVLESDYLFKYATVELIKEKAMNRPLYLKPMIVTKMNESGYGDELADVKWTKPVTNKHVREIIMTLADRISTDNHVNYNKPLAALSTYLDKSSPLPFLKYWTNILRVDFRLIKDYPVNALASLITHAYVGGPSVLNSIGAPNVGLDVVGTLGEVPAFKLAGI